jgi:hypothetical protein
MKIDSEMKSKFYDGVISTFMIYLSMMALIFLIRPFEALGNVGILIFGIVMFISGTWCLVRAETEKLSEIGRAWYGIFSGLFIWTVTEMGAILGWTVIEEWHGLYLVVMVLALVFVVWKLFPSGVQMAIAMFMFNWAGHVLIHLGEYLFSGEIMVTAFNITAAVYGLLAAGTLYVIFARTKTRMQRLWGAVWLWHFISMAVFILRQL